MELSRFINSCIPHYLLMLCGDLLLEGLFSLCGNSGAFSSGSRISVGFGGGGTSAGGFCGTGCRLFGTGALAGTAGVS